MTKRLAFILFLLVAISGSVFADDAAKSLTVKTFQFKFKDADRAAALVRALMSPEGSISIQPASNSMVISDRAENLKAIADRLAAFDTAPLAVKLTIRLVAASHMEGVTKTPDDLKDVAPKLAMLRYNLLESIGSANVEGTEGAPGLLDLLQQGYRAEFKFGEYDAASDTVKINDFKLSKLQGDQLTQLLKTTLNVKLGQTVIVGATKPQGGRALMIIVTAKK